MAMRPTIVVVCEDGSPLCEELLCAVSGIDVRRFDTLAELIAAQAGRLEAVVIGWNHGLRRELEQKQVEHLLVKSLRGVPAILVLEDLPSNNQGIIRLARLLPKLWMVIGGVDSLGSCLSKISAGSYRPGYHDIYEGMAAMLPVELEYVVAAAAIAGDRRRSVEDFASLCGFSVRALELRLQNSGGPVPRELLGWVLSLHILWRLDILGWQPKRVADSVSFRSVDTMALYVERWTGERPRRLLNEGGGFGGLLERCEARFNAPRGAE